MNDRRAFDPYAAHTPTMPGSDAHRPLVVEDDPRWPDAASTPETIVDDLRDWILDSAAPLVTVRYARFHAAASACAAMV